MHRKRLAAGPGVDDEHVGGDVTNLADHVQLGQPIELAALAGDRGQLVPVFGRHLADRVQPVVHQAAALSIHRRRDAAAAVMADDDHVLDAQYVDREL